MSIMNYMLLFLGDVILCGFLSYSWNILLKKKSSIKKELSKIFLMALLTNMISSFFEQPIRLILNYLLFIIINYVFYSKKIKKAILSVAISELIVWLAEYSYIILFSYIFKGNIYYIDDEPFFYVLTCLYIISVSLIILKTKIPKKIYNSLNSSTDKIRKNESILYSLMIIFIVIVSTAESHMKLPLNVIITTNTSMALLFIFIILRMTKVNNKYDKVNNKYQTSINSIKEYEAMIDKFRVNTHENKNELLTIRNMIKNNDKNIIEYIDALVNNKIKDNEKIMYQTSKIPEGGLRATIYSKLCVMDKYKIKYKLDISKSVRTVDLINLDEEVILNICKILGVFLDNAIEEVRNLKKKEVNIELYVLENELYIDIMNNFKGNIDLDIIGRERNTSKGEEHGYGLLLVNKIVKENSKYLDNEKSINGNYFTQTLKIKIK